MRLGSGSGGVGASVVAGVVVIIVVVWSQNDMVVAVMTEMVVFVLFVRDGIHSDADYNSTRVGVVVVVVVVVRIFTMG